MPSQYYDLDAILAEDEGIPCTNLLDFAHLSHLNPEEEYEDDGDDHRSRHLPKNSRFQLPLWSVEKLATLGFVRLGIPKHFAQRKLRERLLTDPTQINLRSRNERFFMSGVLLVDLLQRCASAAATSSGSNRAGNRRMDQHLAATQAVADEARQLQRTLVQTFTGERLRRILDWTLSSIDDDLSHFTAGLTELEMRLFHLSATAATAKSQFQLHGTRTPTVTTVPPPPRAPDRSSSRPEPGRVPAPSAHGDENNKNGGVGPLSMPPRSSSSKGVLGDITNTMNPRNNKASSTKTKPQAALKRSAPSVSWRRKKGSAGWKRARTYR